MSSDADVPLSSVVVLTRSDHRSRASASSAAWAGEDRAVPLDWAATIAGIAWAVLAITLWSGWFVVTRFAVAGRGALGPADLVALRFGISGLVFAPLLVVRFVRTSAPSRRGWRREWMDVFWFVVGMGAPFALLLSIGLRFAPAGHAAALTPGTMPLFAALFGMWVLGERPGRTRIGGLVLIAGGAVALSGGVASADALLGHGIFLVCSALWAASTVRLRLSGRSALDATALTCAASGLLFVPVYLLSGVSRLAEAGTTELVIQALYQGLLVSAVGLLAFNRAVTLIGGKAPAFTALVPVLSTALAMPVLGEEPTLLDATGTVAIACGVVFATLGRARSRARR